MNNKNKAGYQTHRELTYFKNKKIEKLNLQINNIYNNSKNKSKSSNNKYIKIKTSNNYFNIKNNINKKNNNITNMNKIERNS